MGIFRHVWVAAYPAVHPRTHLVMRLRAQRNEIGDHALRIRFVDDQGNELLGGEGGSGASVCGEPPSDGGVGLSASGSQVLVSGCGITGGLPGSGLGDDAARSLAIALGPLAEKAFRFRRHGRTTGPRYGTAASTSLLAVSRLARLLRATGRVRGRHAPCSRPPA